MNEPAQQSAKFTRVLHDLDWQGSNLTRDGFHNLAEAIASLMADAWEEGFEDGADVERNGYWINGKHAKMPNPYRRDAD